jgi:hypothetical protein
MSRWQDMISRHRPSVLAVIMLAMLAAGVAVAALLAEIRSAPVRQGRQVLEQIRRMGLARFWREGTQTDWYLHSDGQGRPLAWSVERRTPGQGGYSGLAVFGDSAKIVQEKWQLDARAQQGRYVANVYVQQRMPRRRLAVRRKVQSTDIKLRGRRAVVHHEGLGRGGAAEDDAPANYIPEGANWLVHYLTALAGETARFRMLINQEAVVGTRLRFVTQEVTPVGPRRVRVRLVPSETAGDRTLHFDEGGRLLREDGPSGSRRLVPADTVLKAFPDAARYARALSVPNDANEVDEGDGLDANAAP